MESEKLRAGNVQRLQFLRARGGIDLGVSCTEKNNLFLTRARITDSAVSSDIVLTHGEATLPRLMAIPAGCALLPHAIRD